jgi:hypothetical protein
VIDVRSSSPSSDSREAEPVFSSVIKLVRFGFTVSDLLESNSCALCEWLLDEEWICRSEVEKPEIEISGRTDLTNLMVDLALITPAKLGPINPSNTLRRLLRKEAIALKNFQLVISP